MSDGSSFVGTSENGRHPVGSLLAPSVEEFQSRVKDAVQKVKQWSGQLEIDYDQIIRQANLTIKACSSLFGGGGTDAFAHQRTLVWLEPMFWSLMVLVGDILKASERREMMNKLRMEDNAICEQLRRILGMEEGYGDKSVMMFQAAKKVNECETEIRKIKTLLEEQYKTRLGLFWRRRSHEMGEVESMIKGSKDMIAKVWDSSESTSDLLLRHSTVQTVMNEISQSEVKTELEGAWEKLKEAVIRAPLLPPGRLLSNITG